ncbi:MAG: DUF937 domain-containing protein, partial [Caulobacteraceae bacterium]|nr:DUF937 domain-containing protein [Caulobacter sp.]
MGLFDMAKGALGSVLGSVSPETVAGAVNQVYPGGLGGLLQKAQESGYGAQVSSWLGHGPNDPITANDVHNILGSDNVKALEQHFGLPEGQIADVLAKALPAAVDHQSPNGQLQEPPPAS